MVRTPVMLAGPLTLFVLACTATSAAPKKGSAASCADGQRNGDETGLDCGGSCAKPCGSSSGDVGPNSNSDASSPDGGATGCADTACIDGVKDGDESDVDCGGSAAPKCAVGKTCNTDSDCEIACSYAKVCVDAPSCVTHLGGDTCGIGEVGQPGVQHESCCRSLPVPGFEDGAHPGKTVYLDKYEVTAGRVRQWIEALAAQYGGNPNVKAWIAAHRPQIWDPAWDAFLPTDWEGPTITIARRLLGDPRPEDNGEVGPPGPGVILPPSSDQVKHLGVYYQFNTEVYVDIHGSDCGTWAGTYGFPTFFYPADILKRDAQLPRADGLDFGGKVIPAKELLDVKSMNCITNEMLAAFCAWDGGQLATDEVLDYVTATPASLGNTSGCGPQIDDHGNLLGNIFTGTVQSGGRCAPVYSVNATFDAGDHLPVDGSPLNQHNYHFPDLGNVTHDKAWQVSAPGRASLKTGEQEDVVRINPGDEPWIDLHGNLNETALDMSGATFTGVFALKYRGLGYGSARSDLNMTYMKGESILRLQRPEAKAAFTGGRCMRFR